MTQVPDERVDLRTYVCGTNACTAGWLATAPFFLEQVGVEDQETAAFDISLKPGMWGDMSLAEDGEDGVSWTGLFSRAGHGTFDKELRAKHGTMSDKQLALARLYRALGVARAPKEVESAP